MVVLLLRAPLARVFSDDPHLIDAAAALLAWVALIQPLSALAFTLDGVLIGATDTRFLAKAMVASSTVYVVAAVAALNLGWGTAGLALGATLWLAARTFATAVRWRGGAWVAPLRA